MSLTFKARGDVGFVASLCGSWLADLVGGTIETVSDVVTADSAQDNG